MDRDLYLAATTGNNDVIIALEDKIDQVSGGNHTVLHLASLCNKYISVDAILEKFPNLLLKMNTRNETALHLAAKKGYFLVVKPLIEKSKTLDPSSSTDFIRKANVEGNTALHFAAQYNHKTVVKEIVEADPNDQHCQNKKSETPLYLAARRGYKDVTELILKNCKDAAIDGPEGKTALHGAVISRNADCVKLILQMKEDIVNKVDNIGWTAMHYAAFHNCASLLQIIEKKKPTKYDSQKLPQRESHMDNPMKKTPLHIAASEGHISALLELMSLYGSKSPIIAAVDEDDRNILHIAVDQKHVEVVKCILECEQIDKLLNKRDKNGDTPLHLLVMRGCFVPELIKHKEIERDAKNNDNFTPSELLYSDEHIVGDQLKIKEALEDVQSGHRRNFWYKRIRPELNTRESEVSSSRRSRKDAKFMKEKANQMEEKVKLYRKRTQTQIIVTALITTVTFTVGFTMPGGYHETEDRENQGSAVLSKKTAFKVCMIADAAALLFSTCSLFFYFISSLYLDPGPVSILNSASVVFNIISVVAMMGTFIAGTYVVLPQSTTLAFIMLAISVIFFPCVGLLSLKWVSDHRTVTKEHKV